MKWLGIEVQAGVAAAGPLQLVNQSSVWRVSLWHEGEHILLFSSTDLAVVDEQTRTWIKSIRAVDPHNVEQFAMLDRLIGDYKAPEDCPLREEDMEILAQVFADTDEA